FVLSCMRTSCVSVSSFVFLMCRSPPPSTLFPYTTLFRSLNNNQFILYSSCFIQFCSLFLAASFSFFRARMRVRTTLQLATRTYCNERLLLDAASLILRLLMLPVASVDGSITV